MEPNQLEERRKRLYEGLESEVARDLLDVAEGFRSSKLGMILEEAVEVDQGVKDLQDRDSVQEPAGTYALREAFKYFRKIRFDEEEYQEYQRKWNKKFGWQYGSKTNKSENHNVCKLLDEIAEIEQFVRCARCYENRDKVKVLNSREGEGASWYNKRQQLLPIFLDYLVRDLVKGSEPKDINAVSRILRKERNSSEDSNLQEYKVSMQVYCFREDIRCLIHCRVLRSSCHGPLRHPCALRCLCPLQARLQ